jgi:hypothetical protein
MDLFAQHILAGQILGVLFGLIIGSVGRWHFVLSAVLAAVCVFVALLLFDAVTNEVSIAHRTDVMAFYAIVGALSLLPATLASALGKFTRARLE